MVKNQKLSRAISDLSRGQFRTFLIPRRGGRGLPSGRGLNKAQKYGREFRVINRWEPTSQTCSACGFRGGKLDLSIREWFCLNCGTKHDRDENAARNILVAGVPGSTHSGRAIGSNGRGRKHQTIAKVAAFDVSWSRQAQTSTHQKPIQLSLFN